MAVQTGEVTAKIAVSHPRGLAPVAQKAWRLGVVVLLGVGLWLGLRWTASARQPLPSYLNAFMADGGGGAMDVRGVYATPEYFRLSRRDPAALGLNPEQEQIFFVMVELHEHDLGLPTSDTWWEEVSLSIDGQGNYRPVKRKVVLSSDFHETVAVAFQPRGDNDELLIPRGEGIMRLDVPNLGDGARSMNWYLPLDATPRQPQGAVPVPSLWALLPLLGGLLVAFSPCLVHMGAYYVPLFGALNEKEVAGRPVRIKTAWAAGLFAMGFTIPYSVAGAAIGYAGQFAKNSSLLATITQPMTYVAGAMVIYFGLQVSGVFQISFLTRLKLPTLKPSGSGYLSSGLLGMNLAVGCLGCVGGSLFAGMLLYSGAVASPLQGGLTLFLFGLAANVPFFLAVITLGRLQLRQFVPLRVTRYVPLISGAILVTLGLLMLSGTEGIIEDALQRAMGITASGL
ncbi:MAG: sulfite exporter TauE/SafE family protein [Chloroflexi bacterium]|nr:sulfite exporter TauE/SafE family protein [Chloroflexota bacterium]